jgi:hypothetical protein
VRRVEVTARRTNQDFAWILRRLVDEWYAQAEKIALELDNLSTHRPVALYEAFEAAEARMMSWSVQHLQLNHGAGQNGRPTCRSFLSALPC